MNITARGEMTIEVEVTYEQARALRIGDLDLIDWQRKTDRILATFHIIGQDRVIFRVRLNARERVTFLGDVKLPDVELLPETVPRFFDAHRRLAEDLATQPEQTLTVNGLPVREWNAQREANGDRGILAGPHKDDRGLMIWRLNLRPNDRVRIE